jgi:polyisoprenyl-phosphate glycosyltransferase
MASTQLQGGSASGSEGRRPVLSVVVPAYNEEAVLEIFHGELIKVLDKLSLTCEILYVNDGSADRTLSVLMQLMRHDARVGIVDLSRNFGKELALTAGLDSARGEAVVVIDADLQDPPDLIEQFVQKWREGFDVVYAKRVSRQGETAFKKLTAYLFYRLIQGATRVEIPADTGDYRLISRRALDALLSLRERHRFMKGLFAWIGFRQVAVLYHRAPRAAGDTKFSYWRLWNFALEGFTSFTIAPLKVASYLGLAISALAFVYAAWIITKTLLYGDPVAGYPSLMVVVLLLGGVQLACLGILGEYLGRMFNETKGRPLYVVNQYFAPLQHDARIESLDVVVQSSRFVRDGD